MDQVTLTYNNYEWYNVRSNIFATLMSLAEIANYHLKDDSIFF